MITCPPPGVKSSSSSHGVSVWVRRVGGEVCEESLVLTTIVLQIPNQLFFSALKTGFSAVRFLRRTGFSASDYLRRNHTCRKYYFQPHFKVKAPKILVFCFPLTQTKQSFFLRKICSSLLRSNNHLRFGWSLASTETLPLSLLYDDVQSCLLHSSFGGSVRCRLH